MNVTVKAPSSIVAGSVYLDRDGGSHTVAAGGLLTVDVKYLADVQAAGYVSPSTFGAVSANITAYSGGGQANATALSYGLNQVATAAAAADSVILPSAVPGEIVTVVNDGAAAVQLFGQTADTINGVAGATGISVPALSQIVLTCMVANQWRAVPGLGYGSQGGVGSFGPAANAIASNGTSLANATLLTNRINRVTTVGAANGGVRLPAALPGDIRVVTNANAANAANVFPAVNEAITGGAANAALNLAANKTALFVCAVAGQWDALLTA